MKIHPALALGLIGFAFSTPVALAETPDVKAASEKTLADPMLEGYAAVSTALYKDDFAAAKKAAAGMAQTDKENALAKPAQAIADSKDIEEARVHFKELS
ncbi:hypothetical protein EON80_29305, partial [bacterium]